MPFPTPFARYEGEVLPAWIDSNDHLNLAYYVVLFDYGTDAIYETFGLGQAYRDATKCGTFAAETHTLYQQELLLGERLRITTYVLSADAKRLHMAHEMHRLSDGKLSAMQEILFLHVDLTARRVVPWHEPVMSKLQAAVAAHSGLPRPDWIGRRVGQPHGA
jgi:acyl-CoA thioester hydrolase